MTDLVRRGVAEVIGRGRAARDRAVEADDAVLRRCGRVAPGEGRPPEQTAADVAEVEVERRRAADAKRLAIAGGSAGGWTVLCALTLSDAFAAGISRYGVADLRRLAEDTHDFEARYLDSMVGPLPEAEALYVARSPLSRLDRLRTPLLIEQGLDDRVVPPSQSEAVRDALRRNGVPHAYLAFEGEGHGFRRAETVVRQLEAEVAFLGRVFGFAPDGLPPLELD